MPHSLPLGNNYDLICGFKAVDLKCGANAGDWIDMQNNAGIGVLFHSAVGCGGDDPTLTIKQAKNACGCCCKAVSLDTNKAFKKQAATDLTCTSVWSSAACCVTAACGTLTNATSAEQVLLWYVYVDASELCVACGFTHVQGSVADIGCNAQLGYLLYITTPKYPSAPADVTSSIC